MDTTTAAAKAGVSTSTIRAWCRIGAIAAHKDGRRWIIDERSLNHRIALGIRKPTPRPTRPSYVEMNLDVCTPEGKTWLARITGINGRYGFTREFINTIARNTSRSGRTGTYTYLVTDGLYESNEGRRRLGRRYWKVENGTITEIDRDELVAAFC